MFSGNGSLQIFHVLKGKLVLAPSLLVNHHSSTGINALSFLGNHDKHYVLASGGNDMELNLWKVPPVQTNNKGRQMIPSNEVLVNDEQVQQIRIFRETLPSKINALETIECSGKTVLLIADQSSTLKHLDVTSFIS